MPKVRVVTAYVPLNVTHLSAVKYHELGLRLDEACGGDLSFFDCYPFSKCWLAMASKLPPASAVPADRYPTPADMVKSNIVQHQRTTWAMEAAALDPSIDIWVWLDLGILKQGDWTGRPVTEDHIRSFLDRLRNSNMGDIVPFPAIWGKGPISDTDVNWRFVGSTHIWPVKWLPAIDKAYKEEAANFIARTQTVPNDLPIWAHVEENHPEIPFVSYSGNHDNTQLVNFRGIPPQTPLCEIAHKHQTDKGEHHGYTTVYWEHLKNRRNDIRRVLEVGIGYKNPTYNAYWPYGASLRMWEEFLPNAEIYGMDIHPEVFINEGRIRSSYVDQGSSISLMDSINKIGGTFDLIVDDGSHILEHQVLTAHVYLPFLAKGGLYIIEDVNQDPYSVINRMPDGYDYEFVKSRAEPDHAYVILIYRRGEQRQ